MIKRLSELSKKELKDLGTFMRGEIQPASISEGSDWVCLRRQRPYFWKDKEIARIAKFEGPASKFQAWTIFEGGPIGICIVTIMTAETERLSTFLVGATGRLEKEQFVIADELALRALSELPERKEIYGDFPALGFSARYATRCGFESELQGKLMAPDPNPILHWTIDPAVLKKNIEVLHDHR